jgi:excisionase family DNA binding protein
MPIATQMSTALRYTEQQQVLALHRMLRGGVPALVSPAGERMELPTAVLDVLRNAVDFMSQGQAIRLVPSSQMVTTQRAADLLGMSRPFFIKLLDSGVMAHHRVGNQRRVALRDVLEFKTKRDEERMAALGRLSRDAIEAGLYERNVFPEGGVDD